MAIPLAQFFEKWEADGGTKGWNNIFMQPNRNGKTNRVSLCPFSASKAQADQSETHGSQPTSDNFPGSYAQSNALWFQEQWKTTKITKNESSHFYLYLAIITQEWLYWVRWTVHLVLYSTVNVPLNKTRQGYNYNLFTYQGTTVKFSKKSG